MQWANWVMPAILGGLVAIAAIFFTDLPTQKDIERLEKHIDSHAVGPPHEGVEKALARIDERLAGIKEAVDDNTGRISRQWDVVNDIQATLRLLQADAARKMQGADR